MKPRLVIVASHPIQYQAPWFRALHEDGRIDLKVLFLAVPNPDQQGTGFDHQFEWDIPLLDGYSWDLAPTAKGSLGAGWMRLRLGNSRKAMSAFSTDVVMVLGWHYRGMAQGIIAAAGLNLPVLVRGDSNGLAPIPLLSRLRNRYLLRNVRSLAPVGIANRRYYEQLGLAHRCSLDIPHFVDNQFFRSKGELGVKNRTKLRESLGVPAESLCFLFAGKLQEKKRPNHLLSAIELASAQTTRPIHLLVIGKGPLEADLKQQAGLSRLSVSFGGFLNQTEMPSAYTASDCLVLPSNFGETWGLVVNEAMACGLPAIVSDRVGCGPDLVKAGETGFTFRFGDVQDLAQRMTEIAKMGEPERKSMGQRARERVCTHYSIERAVENTVAATLKLLGRQQKGFAH